MAKTHEQAVENFASKKQINQFLSWHYKLSAESITQEQVDILRDWRMQLFGEQLLALANDNFADLK